MSARSIGSRLASGLAIATGRRSEIRAIGADLWLVPSSRGPGGYVVDLARGTCSCPDYERRHAACKHLVAAEIVARDTAIAAAIKIGPANDVAPLPSPPAVTYHRHAHAAHYGYGHPAVGHDVETWTVAQACGSPRPADVPDDATADYGHVVAGVQYVVWSRRAPLSPGRCALCSAAHAAGQ